MDLSKIIHYYIVELADDRLRDWALLHSPYAIPLILFSYLYFVLRCGPRYMKDRPPYSLKTFVQCYNVFQVFANAWLVYSFVDAGWFTELGLLCEKVQYTYEPGPMKLASTLWYTLILKLIDLVETFVFVLRKKQRQISFLHIYHHISTIGILWLFMRYFAGGMTAFPVLVNCMVHVIMYTYYFFTMQESTRKIASKFKPLITIIQMVQFVGLIIFCLQGFLPNCSAPVFPNLIVIVNFLINFYLFYNFYRSNYKDDNGATKLKGK